MPYHLQQEEIRELLFADQSDDEVPDLDEEDVNFLERADEEGIENVQISTEEETANETADELRHRNEYKQFMLRVFYERGISRQLISDQEAAFKSIKKDFSDIETKETLDWLKGWKDSDQRKDLEQSYGTQFRFQHPESPENMGLVERLHKTITSSMLSLKQANLKLSQITTLVKGLQCMMNKRPLSGMEKEQIDEVEFVTPNMLLTGWDLNMCPNYTVPKVPKHLIQARADIVHFTRHMKSLYQRVWSKFISTYVDSLNLYKKKNQVSSIIKQGGFVIYSTLNKEMSPVNVFQVCQVLEAIKGRDGQIRTMKVKRSRGQNQRIHQEYTNFYHCIYSKFQKQFLKFLILLH